MTGSTQEWAKGNVWEPLRKHSLCVVENLVATRMGVPIVLYFADGQYVDIFLSRISATSMGHSLSSLRARNAEVSVSFEVTDCQLKADLRFRYFPF